MPDHIHLEQLTNPWKPNHMQKTNFIIKYTLVMKLT